MAGIISLPNDWMLSIGRFPLGFLNPWLYASRFLGLIDITSGSNPGCNTNGFTTVPGMGSRAFDQISYLFTFDVRTLGSVGH